MASQRQERWRNLSSLVRGSGIPVECFRGKAAFGQLTRRAGQGPRHELSAWRLYNRNEQPMNRKLPHCLHRLVIAAFFCALGGLKTAQADQIGPVSGLPIPRYVSLKSDRVNLRAGPSKDHRTLWIYQRAGLPVEITAEFEIWRRVRDSEGTEGWVLHSLLSGRRTALVTPWKKGINSTLFRKASSKSAPVARLQPNVIGNVRGCNGTWCRISGEGFDGYIQQSKLWGVYPGEKIE
jgi:SH3-like domain-containing protein